MEQDFSNLLKPSFVPKAYDDFLREISRRRNTFMELNEIVQKVTQKVN